MSINPDPHFTVARAHEVDRLCRRYVQGEFGSDELLQNIRTMSAQER